MRPVLTLITASISVVVLPAAALASGVLAIGAVAKVPPTSSHPAEILVTGTCVANAGQVKIFLKDTTSGLATKVYTSPGNCGAVAASSGKTVTLPASIVPPGTYLVILKQGSAISPSFGPITLP